MSGYIDSIVGSPVILIPEPTTSPTKLLTSRNACPPNFATSHAPLPPVFIALRTLPDMVAPAAGGGGGGPPELLDGSSGRDEDDRPLFDDGCKEPSGYSNASKSIA